MNTFEVNYTVYGEAQEPILITVSGGMTSVRKAFWEGIILNHWKDSVKIISIDYLCTKQVTNNK